MSRKTRTALGAALMSHLEDEMPGMVGGAWVVLVEASGVSGSDAKPVGGWMFESEGSVLSQIGMLEVCRQEKLAEMRSSREDQL